MDILIQPSSLSLVGSMNHFVIYATTDISFVLSDNTSGEVIVQHTYTPSDTNRIEIDLKNIIHPLLLFKLQDVSSPYQQTDIVKTFNVVVTEVKTDGTIGASKTSTFTVLRGGVDHFDGDTPSFLQQNFLTWQPNVKPVTYYTPEFLTYYATVAATVRCKAYLEGGTSKEFALAQFSAGQCWTIPVQYAIIAGKCGSQMPMYYDVWVENGSGQRMTYIQRYYATDMRSEEEEWILFENSLGGIDTFRAYGDSENTAEHTHNVAEIEEDFEEYRVDTTRKFKKNTGYLGKKERTWLLDFFPSLGKYIYVSSCIRRIVVTDSDVSYNAKELPSTYNFTYKYADARPYLNIPRVDTPQTVLNIKVPELGSFTIAPRLVEFPRLTLSGGALFPVQNPYSEQWTVTTAAAILEYLIHALEADYSGGGGIGHTHPNITLLNGLYLLEDYLLVNGNKIKAGYADVAKNLSDDSPVYRKFIRKDQDDRTNYNLGVGGTLDVDRDLNVHGDAVIDGSVDVGIRARTKDLDVTGKATIEELQVNGDSVFAGAMSSPLFRSGFLDGYGWALFKKVVENALGVKEDKYTLEIDNLIVRQSMRVFEMIISQLLGENDNRVFAAMMEVDHYDQASGKVYFNNHDGKLYNPFRKHDYIEVQQYNPAATDGWVIKHYELVIAEVGTGYEDGERVDWVKIYGFVSASGATAAELIAQGDTFTRVDNAVDQERKGIVTVTSVGAKTPYIDIIYGLKSDPDHSLKGRIGNLEGLRTPQFGWLKGFGEYLNNLYAVGHFKMATTGENVSARIEANESRLSSTYSETLYNIKEEDNLLKNGMFTRGLDEWGVCDLDSLEEIENELSTQEQQSNLVTVSDGTTIAPMFLNGGTVGQKHKSHVVAETFDGTQVLHLYEVGIFQHWSKMRANGTHDIVEPVEGEEDQYRTKAVANTLFFSIRFLAKTSGVLKLEFFDDNSGRTAVRTWNITASDEWQIRQVDDKDSGWFYDPNENGRFIVTYSGEIILRFITLMNSPLDDYKQTVSTQFIQTSRSIQLLGQKYTALNSRLTNLGIELNADLENIRLYVDTTTEAMEQRLGLRIDGVDGKVELYAEKLENDYYDKSAIDVKIGEISSLVAGIQTDLADQKTIIEQIRNLAIDAANAEVYTQTTNPWSQWTGGTGYKHVGAVWHYVLESGVTTSPTIYLIDGTQSHPDVGKAYRYVGYDSTNKWEPIDDITASASYILQTKDYISAVVANFDEDGNVLESSGIVTTEYGNTLWASKTDYDSDRVKLNTIESNLSVLAGQVSIISVNFNPDGSIAQSGYIYASVNDIRLGIEDELGKTGIDISNKKIYINAENTVFNGNIRLSNPNEGIIIFDSYWNERISILNKTIGVLNNFDFGSDKRFSQTKSVSTYTHGSTLTVVHDALSLGTFTTGQKLDIHDMFIDGYFSEHPFDTQANLKYTYVVKCIDRSASEDVEYTLKTVTANISRGTNNKHPFSFAMNGYTNSSLPYSGEYYLYLTAEYTFSGDSLSYTGLFRSALSLFLLVVNTGINRIGTDGAVFSSAVTKYNWFGSDRTEIRCSDNAFRVEFDGIKRTAYNSYRGGFNNIWSDISSTMPYAFVNSQSYTAGLNVGIIIFSTVLGVSNPSYSLYLPKPSDCPGKVYFVKNIADNSSSTKVYVSGDTSGANFMDPDDTQTRTNIDIGKRSSIFVSALNYWVHFYCG